MGCRTQNTGLFQGLSCRHQILTLSDSPRCQQPCPIPPHPTLSWGTCTPVPPVPAMAGLPPAAAWPRPRAAPTEAKGTKTRDLGPSPTCFIGGEAALHKLWLANKELRIAAAPTTQMLADPGQGHPVLPSAPSLLIAAFCAAFPQRQLQSKVLVRSWPCQVALAQQSCQIGLWLHVLMADATSGCWAVMEETLGFVLAVKQEPPQVSPPFLLEAPSRCCLAKPSPVHSAGKELLVQKGFGSWETSGDKGTPGVGVLLPAWCPDSEPRAASGFWLRCRHRSGQMPPATLESHPAGLGGGKQSLGAGIFWDLSKGKLIIQVLLQLYTIMCPLQLHFKQP